MSLKLKVTLEPQFIRIFEMVVPLTEKEFDQLYEEAEIGHYLINLLVENGYLSEQETDDWTFHDVDAIEAEDDVNSEIFIKEINSDD